MAWAGVLMAVGPLALWALPHSGWDPVLRDPNVLFLTMLLSAPLCHAAGCLQWDAEQYRIFQPLLGGFRYITTQVANVLMPPLLPDK